MADELTLTVAFSYEKGTIPTFARTLASDLGITVSGNRFHHNVQNISTSEEALGLGDLSSPFGWFFAVNRDSTNYLEIRSATGSGNDIIRLNAGECCALRLGSDISAPYAIANTAACDLEYVIFQP